MARVGTRSRSAIDSSDSASVEFFRLDESTGDRLETMGDCGAFNYVHEEEPPYSVDEVFDFYEECGFDYGISVDHIILGVPRRQQRRTARGVAGLARS